jgi:hypothetical protein
VRTVRSCAPFGERHTCRCARDGKIGGNFIRFTAIGVYVEDAAVPALAKRWAGKTADELAFFRDIGTGGACPGFRVRGTARRVGRQVIIILFVTNLPFSIDYSIDVI